MASAPATSPSGYPTARLLVITSARFADRTGAVHQGPLLPDVPTAGPDALGAALTGLGRQ